MSALRGFRGYLVVALSGFTLIACGAPSTVVTAPLAARDDPFLDTVQTRTFGFFWQLTNPRNGLVPDRAPTPSFSSVAAIGFGLAAYPVGVVDSWM